MVWPSRTHGQFPVASQRKSDKLGAMMRQYELVERVRAYDPNVDEDRLNRAYVFTVQMHGTQKRASGDPYFSHPVEVAGLMTELKMDADTIITALLHDTVEDTETTLAEIEARFGGEVAGIVAEVTDDKNLPKPARKELQVTRAAHKSPGAKLVKLADKIANLRDLAASPPADWPAERRAEYVRWSARVVEGLRGSNPALEAAFDAAHAALAGDVAR